MPIPKRTGLRPRRLRIRERRTADGGAHPAPRTTSSNATPAGDAPRSLRSDEGSARDYGSTIAYDPSHTSLAEARPPTSRHRTAGFLMRTEARPGRFDNRVRLTTTTGKWSRTESHELWATRPTSSQRKTARPSPFRLRKALG